MTVERHTVQSYNLRLAVAVIRNIRVNAAVSINTTERTHSGLFRYKPIVERIKNMFRLFLVACAVPTVWGIIVKDPEPMGDEYKYSYEIDDPSTGDSKSLHEVRHGDVVSGSYSVLDPDGSKRTVHYTADAKHGFKAVVTQEPAASEHGQLALTQHYITQSNQLSDYQYSTLSANPVYTNYIDPYHQDVQSRYSNRDKYFTPANELPSGKAPFNGLYFEPNNQSA